MRNKIIQKSPWLPFFIFLFEKKEYQIDVIPKTNIIYCKSTKTKKEIIFIDHYWSVVPQGVGLALASETTSQLLLKYSGFDQINVNGSLFQIIYTVYIDIFNNFYIFFDKKKNKILMKNSSSCYDEFAAIFTAEQKKHVKKSVNKLLRLVSPCSYLIIDFSVSIRTDNRKPTYQMTPFSMSLDVSKLFYEPDVFTMNFEFTEEMKHKLLYTLCEDSVKYYEALWP